MTYIVVSGWRILALKFGLRCLRWAGFSNVVLFPYSSHLFSGIFQANRGPWLIQRATAEPMPVRDARDVAGPVVH